MDDNLVFSLFYKSFGFIDSKQHCPLLYKFSSRFGSSCDGLLCLVTAEDIGSGCFSLACICGTLPLGGTRNSQLVSISHCKKIIIMIMTDIIVGPVLIVKPIRYSKLHKHNLGTKAVVLYIIVSTLSRQIHGE